MQVLVQHRTGESILNAASGCHTSVVTAPGAIVLSSRGGNWSQAVPHTDVRVCHMQARAFCTQNKACGHAARSTCPASTLHMRPWAKKAARIRCRCCTQTLCDTACEWP
jgi:hypothetical protein